MPNKYSINIKKINKIKELITNKIQNLPENQKKELQEILTTEKKHLSDDHKKKQSDFKDKIFAEYSKTDIYQQDNKKSIKHSYITEKDYRNRRYKREIPLKALTITIGALASFFVKDYFENHLHWVALEASLMACIPVFLLSVFLYCAKIEITSDSKSKAHSLEKDKKTRSEIKEIAAELLDEYNQKESQSDRKSSLSQKETQDITNNNLKKSQNLKVSELSIFIK